MFRRKKNQAGVNEPRRDTLSELLASEGQLGSRLAQARLEAERLVREAETYAQDVARASGRKIDERIAAIQAQEEAELTRELQAITTDAARETSLLDQVDGDQLHELVALVLTRLVRTEESPRGVGVP